MQHVHRTMLDYWNVNSCLIFAPSLAHLITSHMMLLHEWHLHNRKKRTFKLKRTKVKVFFCMCFVLFKKVEALKMAVSIKNKKLLWLNRKRFTKPEMCKNNNANNLTKWFVIHHSFCFEFCAFWNVKKESGKLPKWFMPLTVKTPTATHRTSCE